MEQFQLEFFTAISLGVLPGFAIRRDRVKRNEVSCAHPSAVGFLLPRHSLRREPIGRPVDLLAPRPAGSNGTGGLERSGINVEKPNSPDNLNAIVIKVKPDDRLSL